MADQKNVASSNRFRSVFAGRRIMVTGGSSGIGRALAQQLVCAGAHVCIVARDEERLATVVGELRSMVCQADQIVCAESIDVTSAVAVDRGTVRVLEALGGVDILINNAGYAICGYIDRLDAGAYDTMMAVNYHGPVNIVRALLPHFLARRSGHIVNVTSMLGFMGTFGYAAYCASKHALAGFTECLRQDLVPFNVSVHLCYPPTTKTPGLERENLTKPPESWAIEGMSKAFSPEAVAQSILRGVAKRRFHIVTGFDSWIIWFVQRVAPWIVRYVTDSALKRYLREHGGARKLSGAGEAN
jgi:short-subunit dehydrogenase